MVLFTMVLSSIVSVFDCVKITPQDYVLRQYPSERCYTSEWYGHIGEVSVFILLYLVVFPLRMLWIFSRMAQNPEIRSVPEFYHLTSGYRPQYFWWDAVLVFKRIVFVLFSQLLFPSVDSSLKLVSSILSFVLFYGVELLCKPYQSFHMAKNNLNLMLILILLCQGTVFENENSRAVNVFIGFAILLFSVCIGHSLFVLMRKKFIKLKSPVVLIDSTAMCMLNDDIRRELFQLCSDEICEKRGEMEIDVRQFAKKQNGFSIKDILNCRRQCDVLYGESVKLANVETAGSHQNVYQGDQFAVRMSSTQLFQS
jgi:hypothetical protein